jgi:hypothetical protein
MIDTHNLIVEFGRHKGERWTRVPISYLKWLVNVGSQYAEIAKSELERRGTILTYEVNLPGHAIDRASLRCRRIWHETAQKDEGIYSWLSRICMEALNEFGKQNTVYYQGLKLIFEHGEIYPTLKTVMTGTCPHKEKREIVRNDATRGKILRSILYKCNTCNQPMGYRALPS